MHDYSSVAQRYKRSLYGVAWRILRNHEDAEDAVQNAHLNALAHLDQFSGRSALSTWAMRIAYNEALCGLRRRVTFVDVDTLPLASTARNPEQEAVRVQLKNDILKAVQSLPKDYRSVFILREFRHLDSADTAAQLGLTVECVKSRLYRAKAMLQQKLRRHMGSEAGSTPDRSEERPVRQSSQSSRDAVQAL